jgi:hypothetical protein
MAFYTISHKRKKAPLTPKKERTGKNRFIQKSNR